MPITEKGVHFCIQFQRLVGQESEAHPAVNGPTGGMR